MDPPHTIILVPVQTARWLFRAAGAPTVEVLVQLSVPGEYTPPVFVDVKEPSLPPQTIMLLPVQTEVAAVRAETAALTFVALQESPMGS
jgi:hypothetical protein